MTPAELQNHLKLTRQPIDIRNREVTEEMRELQAREEVEFLNRAALIQLMLEHGFTIKQKEFDTWRPTKRKIGSIPAIWERVEIIATNGIIGYFLHDDNVVVGHIQMFDGKVEPLHQTPDKQKPKTKKPRPKSKRQQLIDLI